MSEASLLRRLGLRAGAADAPLAATLVALALSLSRAVLTADRNWKDLRLQLKVTVVR